MLYSQDWLLVLSSIGFVIALYSWYVDLNLHRHPKYKPLCDFYNSLSCSKNFTSKYSRVFGISTAFIGVVAYALIFILSSFGNFGFVNVIAFLAVGSSIILAYMSYVKLRNFCLVCTLSYLINIALLFVSYRALGA